MITVVIEGLPESEECAAVIQSLLRDSYEKWTSVAQAAPITVQEVP